MAPTIILCFARGRVPAKRVNRATTPMSSGGGKLITSHEAPGEAIIADAAKIYIYRHLLRNIGFRRVAVDAHKWAPRIKGPRAAAVLARLWADRDLGLSATPQKVIAHDLGISESDVAKMIKDLRGKGDSDSCVMLVSSAYTRENLYEISELGKQELEKWILAYYTHESFPDVMKKIKPTTTNVAPMLDALRIEVRKRLGR